MKSNTTLLLVAIFARAILSVAQTVHLAGDSTMASGGGGEGTQGWGEYLGVYLTIPVVNRAVAGTSARSYTEEGRFQDLINTVKKGDHVIIEFGHNDGYSGRVDNGREDPSGSDYSATRTVTDPTGHTHVIHSFTFYIQNAVDSLKAKGAVPIVASQTPDNLWYKGSIVGPPRFVGYAQIAAQRTGVSYVDHYAYVAQAFDKVGQTTVDNTFYPHDHVHTSPAGAEVVAQAFVRGLLCGSSSLRDKVNSQGRDVPNGCL